MNVTCFDRFVSWFSYHLSNFQFRWSWEDWEDVVPESFHSLVPELPEPYFKYTMPGSATTDVTDGMEQDTNGSSMEKNVAAKVENAIKQKATQEEVLELLK